MSNWNFDKDGPVELAGEYEFYLNRFISPKTFKIIDSIATKNYLPVHSYWNGAMTKNGR